jgi:hypothetical protein
LAGIVASYGLMLLFGQPPVTASQLIGAAFIIAAILFFSLPTSRPDAELVRGCGVEFLRRVSCFSSAQQHEPLADGESHLSAPLDRAG